MVSLFSYFRFPSSFAWAVAAAAAAAKFEFARLAPFSEQSCCCFSSVPEPGGPGTSKLCNLAPLTRSVASGIFVPARGNPEFLVKVALLLGLNTLVRLAVSEFNFEAVR